MAILKKDGSQIITAPANYDSDDPKFKEYELFERLADNVEHYSWTYNVDQSDVESSCTKLTEKEAINIIKMEVPLDSYSTTNPQRLLKLYFIQVQL